ncbi:hypothetical protein ACOSQ4_003083 [Xanthoceras sorbifolium]
MVIVHTLTPHIGAPSTFQRFFLSFQAQKEGFIKGCRPFLGVDGCHLKGKFPGVLLSTIVMCASNTKFDVKDGVRFYIVNLDKQVCDCGLWKLSGLPCKHAMVVITTMRKQPSDYVHHYLKKEVYMRTYGHVMHPILNQSNWPDVVHNTVLPPLRKRKPGRPKKKEEESP